MFASLRSGLQRLRALFSRRRLDEDFDREILAHILLLTEENIRRGMTPEEAHYAALRSFGRVTQVKETNHERRGLHHLEILLQDLRYGFHGLRKNSGFAAIAIAILAIGIGASTAIFQLLDVIRIRSLPVKAPQELVEIRLANPEGRRGSTRRFGQLTNPLWEQIRNNNQAFAGMFAWGETQFNLTRGGEGRYAQALMVSGDFFNVLAVAPVLGRVLNDGDDTKGCAPVAVISYSFWQREFGGSPAAIGSKLLLDTHPVEVIGVTPANFFGIEVGRSYDVAAPLCAEPALRGENSFLTNGTMWWLVAVGRLKPDWSPARTNAYLDSISPGIFQATLPVNYPQESIKDYLGFKLEAFPGGAGVSQLRNDYTSCLWLLLGTSGLVLLIACANLANLMLARAAARDREIAVRLALGASHARLLRQLATESFLLSVSGSVLGLWLAKGLCQILISFLDINGNQVFLDLKLDWSVLGFNAGLAVLTCILFGTTPALRATRTDPGMALKSGSHSLTANPEKFGMRRALVVAQVALSLVLLTTALLFSRSLYKLLNLDAGFRQSGVVVASLDFGRLDVAPERRMAFKQELLDRLQAIPGVESVASTDIIPVSGDSWSNNVWMDTSAPTPGPEVLFNRVSSNYFKALEIQMVAGRTFDNQDVATGPKVAIVNEAFARQFTNGANPVGRRFWRQQTPREPQTLYEIVGLVKNTKYLELREDFRPIVFTAALQDPNPDMQADVLLRSDLPLAGIMSAIKSEMAGISPEIVIDFDNLKSIIRDSLLRERILAALSGFFGGLAALLATLGLYGVISYMVARRRNEIGIRMALGADRLKVVGLIMREATLLLAIGVGIGSVLSLLAAKAADSLLFGLNSRDLLALISAAALLAAITLAASYLPSHRAAQLDPVAALRQE